MKMRVGAAIGIGLKPAYCIVYPSTLCRGALSEARQVHRGCHLVFFDSERGTADYGATVVTRFHTFRSSSGSGPALRLTMNRPRTPSMGILVVSKSTCPSATARS